MVIWLCSVNCGLDTGNWENGHHFFLFLRGLAFKLISVQLCLFLKWDQPFLRLNWTWLQLVKLEFAEEGTQSCVYLGMTQNFREINFKLMEFTRLTNLVMLLKPAFLTRTPFPPPLLTLCRMGFAFLLLLRLLLQVLGLPCSAAGRGKGSDLFCSCSVCDSRELMITMQGPETVLCHPPGWQCHSEGQKLYF